MKLHSFSVTQLMPDKPFTILSLWSDTPDDRNRGIEDFDTWENVVSWIVNNPIGQERGSA